MEGAFTSGLASNGVMVIIGGIGYFIYNKCNSKCSYNSKTGWDINLGGGDISDDEEDNHLNQILEMITIRKESKKVKKRSSIPNIIIPNENNI